MSITKSGRRRLGALLGAAALTVAALAASSPAVGAVGIDRSHQPNPSYNGLSLTPPMGWNDWSYYQCNIDENLILTQAKKLVTSGLAKAGYNQVNVDDCWMAGQRNSSGQLTADPTRFPHGMAWLVQQVHNLGLKFGIYLDAGTETCGVEYNGYPGSGIGSYGNEATDAATIAGWKVDYLKLDACSMPTVPGETTEQTFERTYSTWSKDLLATHRPIVFSASMPAYFQGQSDWQDVIADTSKLANLWREGSDIEENSKTTTGVVNSGAAKWKSIVTNFNYNVGLGQYAGPGHWNDPDFLLVGDPGLSTTQMQSQMSLWAEMAAPLISSTDLTSLTPDALKVLNNKAIIAVDQDKLGVQGSIVQSGTGYDVLAKPLSNGDEAVVLFNQGSAAQTIATTPAAIGLTDGAPYQFTDLVTGQSTTVTGLAGSANTSVIAANVPADGTVMFRVHPDASLKVTAGAFTAGHPTVVTATLTNNGSDNIRKASTSLAAPDGWTVQPLHDTFGEVRAGSSAAAQFRVTPAVGATGTISNALTATTKYQTTATSNTLTADADVNLS